MKAIVITERGGPDVLQIHDVPEPVPGPFQVLVRVRASALNRADLLQRRGLYPAPPCAPADIPGLELAGEVVALGPHVSRLAIGDPVMAIVGGGAGAELAVVHEREAIRVPAGMDLVEAAAIPEAFVTAFDAAVLQGGLRSGQWLAINAVGSGVGTAAVQIARALGARSVGSSRTASKLERATALGLDIAVEGDSAALATAAASVNGGQGAAVCVDLVGGPGTSALLRGLRTQGQLILVGLMGGMKADIPLATVLRSRLGIRGTVLRSRSIEEKIAVARAFEDQLAPLFGGDGPQLRPVIDRIIPWAEAADGHRALEANDTFGKVVLRHAG